MDRRPLALLLLLLLWTCPLVAQIPDSHKVIVSPDGLREAEVTTDNELKVNCTAGCAGAGGTQDVNITEVGGNPVTTTVPISGTITADAGAGTFTVGAVNLDIRDLVFASDKVDVSGSTVTATGSGNFTVVQPTGTNLHIVCDAGCGGAATFADDSAFTFGTTSINITGYVFDDTAPNAVTENNAAAPRMSGNRVPYSILRDAAGNERGANVTAGNALVVDGSAVTQPISSAELTSIDGKLVGPSSTSTETVLDTLSETVSLTVEGYQSIGVRLVNSAFSGQLTFEGSIDGAAWFGVPVLSPSYDRLTTWTSTSGSGNFQVHGTAVVKQFRVRVSSYTSGSVTATIVANMTNPQIPPGLALHSFSNIDAAFTSILTPMAAADETGVAVPIHVTSTTPGASDNGVIVRQVGTASVTVPDAATAATVLDTLNEAITLTLNGRQSVALQIITSSSPVGYSLLAEVSLDGSTWVSTWMSPWSVPGVAIHQQVTVLSLSNPSTGYWTVMVPRGALYARVRVEGVTSGSVTALLGASQISTEQVLQQHIPFTNGGFGGLTGDGESNDSIMGRLGVYNFIWNGSNWDRLRGTTTTGSANVSVTGGTLATITGSVVPGTAATNLGKAEDAGHTTGDVGVAMLAVRNDGGSTQTTNANGDYTNAAVDAYGALYARQDHPNRIACNITSTATTSTLVTGCTAPGAGLSIYLTALQWSSSIISTTTNFMTIQDGTGGNCGANVTVHYRGFIPAAFNSQNIVFQTPIKADANSEICFLHPGAGTRLVSIQGFIAP